MSFFMREFRLSSTRNASGVSCGPDGAFAGAVALLKREAGAGSGEIWVPRDGGELSAALSEAYGLPVDVAAKSGGLAAVARALNSGDVARAQIATVLLQLPEIPPLAKGALLPDALVKLAVSLDWSGLLKINFNHYPAKTPGGKGGQFAPKDGDTQSNQGAEDQSGSDPTDYLDNLDDPARGETNGLAGNSGARNAASAGVEAVEQAGERQAARSATRAMIRELALSAEKKTIRIATRRAFRAAALEALKKIGSKLALSEIPIVGEVADLYAVYDVYRFVKEFAELRTAIKAATRFVNEGAHTLADLRVSAKSLTFPDYKAFVKVESVPAPEGDLEKRFGPAGDGMEYHHIVERSAGEAASVVESTDNIVRIPTILHEAISARYGKKIAESGNLSLRNWLKGQPVAVKRYWGIRILRECGIIVE